MAGEKRTATSPLIGELLQDVRQFGFFQAVNLLERAEPDIVPIGGDGPVERETLRLRANASLGFPSSDISSIETMTRPEAALPDLPARYRLTVNFMGLYGAGSPLPAFYSEDIVAGNEAESSRRDFLDLFHHRYLSFVYRSWEKYRYYLRYRPGARDQFSQWLAGLIGLADMAEAQVPVERPERLLSSIGLLLLHGRSAATLASLISHYFDGLPVRIEQFIARQVVIEPAQRAHLGTANCALGVDCTLGLRVPDVSGKFRICVGPLSFAKFRGLLPDAAGYASLRRLVPFLLKDQLDYDLALTLRGTEIPVLELSPDCPARLGWSTWLGQAPERDSEVVLSI